nr:2-oxo acid dehydrogenase subunit E2 [Candidatus Ishikawaella capsulata]
MSIEIKLPDIGSDTVEVTDILVNVGEFVETDHPLITVEGDKASMEIPAPFAGIIKEINVSIGDKLNTGSNIMIFDKPDKSEYLIKDHIKDIKEKNTAVHHKDIVLPDIGNNEMEITEIKVKIGDNVSVEQTLIIIEGDKASIEIPAPFSGKVIMINVAVGDKVKTGLIIMVFEVVETENNKISKPLEKTLDSNSDLPIKNNNCYFPEYSYVHATPVIRRLAREFGIDLSNIIGTGRKGRILKEDLKSYINKLSLIDTNSVKTASSSSLPSVTQLNIDFSKFGEVEEIELSRIKKISGANLSKSWSTIPHVTHFDKYDITDLEGFRQKLILELKNNVDIKITPLVFIMKAVAYALKRIPHFNSSLSYDCQKLILKKYINIGVAVDTTKGLVVPVFKNVYEKGIIKLSEELIEMSKKARSGKLMINDMQGGCFTISSLGKLGTTAFTPIINTPEVAILGISKSHVEPVWNGKKFIPRLMLPISLSFDHRVIEGADAARFIAMVGNILTDIRRLIM